MALEVRSRTGLLLGFDACSQRKCMRRLEHRLPGYGYKDCDHLPWAKMSISSGEMEHGLDVLESTIHPEPIDSCMSFNQSRKRESSSKQEER